MLSFIKQVWEKVGSPSKTIAKIIGFTIIAIVRFISSSGQALFALPKLLELFHAEKHPAQLPLSMGALFANLSNDTAVRLPVVIINSSQPPAIENQSPKKLNLLGKIMFTWFNICIGITTVLRNFLITPFATYNFFKFVVNRFHKNMPEAAIEKYPPLVFFAIAAFFIFKAYNLKAMHKNARRLSLAATKRETYRKLDKYTAAAFTIAILFSGPCAGSFAAYTTEEALKAARVPTNIANYFKLLAYIAESFATPLSSGAAIFDKLTEEKSLSTSPTSSHSKIKNQLAKGYVYVAGSVSVAGTYGIPNINAFLRTYGPLFRVALTNPLLLAFAAIFATLSMTAYFFFSTYDGFNQTMEYVRNRKKINPETEPLISPDIENNSRPSEQTQPIPVPRNINDDDEKETPSESPLVAVTEWRKKTTAPSASYNQGRKSKPVDTHTKLANAISL